MPTYARAPVEFVRGEGARLWDSEGKEYLDLFAGLSVHNPATAIRGSSPRSPSRQRDLQGSRTSTTPSRRCGFASGSPSRASAGSVFLCNSGAEANECAIKLARKHAHSRGIGAPEIVVLDGAFHGRTLGTLAATPRLAREEDFGPLPAGCLAVPRDDPQALCERRSASVPPRSCSSRSRVRPACLSRRRRPGRRSRGLRRIRRAAHLRRDPDGNGQNRVVVGLRAAPRASRRDHRGESARRWPPARRLRDLAGSRRRARAR